MLLRETVLRCSTCDETTPHSRRLIAVPLLVALACLMAAAWCFTLDTEAALLGVLLLWVSVFTIRRDRERFWHVHCVRCRGKNLADLRRTKPSLTDGTEIGPF